MQTIIALTTVDGNRYKIGKNGVVLIEMEIENAGRCQTYWYIIYDTDGLRNRISSNYVATITYKRKD